MTTFDKICAVCAIPLGILLMLLGGFGLFFGAKAQFTLPPILGVLPFFVGWAMSVTLIRFWRTPSPYRDSGFATPPEEFR